MIMEINVLNLDSACALTLKQLRAKIEPIYDGFLKDKHFMRTAFSYIVSCTNEFVS